MQVKRPSQVSYPKYQRPQPKGPGTAYTVESEGFQVEIDLLGNQLLPVQVESPGRDYKE